MCGLARCCVLQLVYTEHTPKQLVDTLLLGRCQANLVRCGAVVVLTTGLDAGAAVLLLFDTETVLFVLRQPVLPSALGRHLLGLVCLGVKGTGHAMMVWPMFRDQMFFVRARGAEAHWLATHTDRRCLASLAIQGHTSSQS
jgi:hypothetical protein